MITMKFHPRPFLAPACTDQAREARIAALGRVVCSSCMTRAGRAHAAYRQRVEIRARSAEQITRMESALTARISGIEKPRT
ncbi:hypothetical protein GIY62_14670 [Burkholderia plantarii]|uniref:hypothetical protein n=1 Tax=Burkholderia plantarii TaxID=41899 RepID=UPI00272BF4F5|nr:hypothetical protein [Burkholderia plantarii]WLE58370.1 hypothetical protein GIY62_14670 [Burkholderia plantarii]